MDGDGQVLPGRWVALTAEPTLVELLVDASAPEEQRTRATARGQALDCGDVVALTARTRS